jgi:hypothetical protein
VFLPTRRLVISVAFFALAASIAIAKDKKKSSPVPTYILNAHTAAVVIEPGSSEPLTNPGLNRNAADEVERALSKWGRLRPTLDPYNADLVIVIHKANNGAGPVIRGGPLDQRPVILQPSDPGVRIGTQTGRLPGTYPTDTVDTPRIGTGAAYGDDLFEVHQGNQHDPIESPILWRYSGRDGLKSPRLPAVEAFRAAIEEAEEQAKAKPTSKP